MRSLFYFVVVVCALFAATSNASVQVPVRVENLHQAMAGDCDSSGSMEPEAHGISEKATLYLLPCYAGAYNFTYRAYLLENAGESYEMVAPVSELMMSHNGKLVTHLDLVNPYYNPETNTLVTYAKGRGIGDCGYSSTTRIEAGEYGGVEVVTVEIRNKPECDGDMGDDGWPVVFTQ